MANNTKKKTKRKNYDIKERKQLSQTTKYIFYVVFFAVFLICGVFIGYYTKQLRPEKECYFYLNGDSTITINVGDEYEELGVTLSENGSSDYNIIIIGEVDNNVAGIYILTYKVDEVKTAYKNASLTRIVHVVGSEE